MMALIEVTGQLQALAAVSPVRYPGANIIGSSVSPRAAVDFTGKSKKLATPPALETWTFWSIE
jgi:hypothetical protein